VCAHVPCQPLDPPREVDELADLGVGGAGRLQLGARGGGLLQRDAELVGHEGHDLVHLRQRHAEGAAHVADRRPGRQGAEGADLGDVRRAVLPLDVVDNLAAPLLAEVDVDIGRLAAVDVEKPLEQQVVLQRADVRQVEGVGDQRAHA
jgi:hypothetical protein